MMITLARGIIISEFLIILKLIMIAPHKAPVRPRVLSPQTGDSLLLEEVIRDLVARRNRGAVCITGPVGSGKTTALEHVAFVFAGDKVLFLDEPNTEYVAVAPSDHWLVYSTDPNSAPATETFRLAPWGEDECIEYLLAAHKERARSVMTRLRADTQLPLLQGNPQLLRLALDQLANVETLTSTRSALIRSIEQLFLYPDSRYVVQSAGFELLLDSSRDPVGFAQLNQRGEESLLPLVRHRPVQLLLAVEYVMRDLLGRGDGQCFEHRWPRDLVLEIAAEVAKQSAVVDILRSDFALAPEQQAVIASILHAAKIGWSPAGQQAVPGGGSSG